MPTRGRDMSAFLELRTTGVVGRESVELLVRLIGQIVRTGASFPPPLGHRHWTDQAVIDYVGVVLATPRGARMLVGCALAATSQGSLERQLLTSIRRFMVDEAKSTPIGKLRRRLQRLFNRDPQFIDARRMLGGDHGWTIAENGTSPWAGDVDELLKLTSAVQVAPIEHLNRSGPTPRAVQESLLTLSYEGLRLAGGAIRAQVIARFLYRRFDLAAADPTTPSVVDPSGTALTLGEDDEVSVLAREIYAGLTDEERRLLRALARETHPTGVASLGEELRARLRMHSGSETGRDAVALVIRWCGQGTAHGVTSSVIQTPDAGRSTS